MSENTVQWQGVRPANLWVQHLLVLAALLLALAVSSALMPLDAEAYPFWPTTAFAIATLLYQPRLFWSVALGLWFWGVLGPLGWVTGTLNLLTLSGPLLYYRLHARWTPPESIPTRRLLDLARIVSLSLMPSALVGAALLWASGTAELLTLAAAFMLYLLSDFAGTVIFLPIVAQWLKQDHAIDWRYLAATIGLVLVSPALVALGLQAYAQTALFLVLPFLTWAAQTANRATLSHCLLVIFIGYFTMAFFGLGGYAPVNTLAQMASLTLLMAAVYLTLDTLQGMRVDRDLALHQAEWLSLHDNRAPAMNERGLMQWAEKLDNLADYGAILYRPVNQEIYRRSLSWEKIGAMEARLISLLEQRIPGAQVAKLSDLTMMAVAPADSLSDEHIRPLLQVQITLDDARFTLDGAVAGVTRLSSDMAVNLSRLNELWARAVSQPYQRLELEHDAPSAYDAERRIMQFQQYRSAVENAGLELWLQPIRALNSGLIDKAEVLARLRVEDRLISPGVFLPVFNDFNYLTEFDRQVLEKTFQHFQQMHDSLEAGACININISGATLSDQVLLPWLKECLHQYQIDPHDLGIEITETELVSDKLVAITNIEGMRQLGFNVAIDDFGAGLASFEYLNQFAVNVLKLDGQFISDVADNPRHQAIVRSMVSVARSYNLELVGEFVDNQAALECLRELGVQYAQGFHVGKPSPDWNA